MHLSGLKFEAIDPCLPSAKTLDMGYCVHSMLIFQISDKKKIGQMYSSSKDDNILSFIVEINWYSNITT